MKLNKLFPRIIPALLFCLLFMATSLELNAQKITQFSEDQHAFMNELDAFLNTSKTDVMKDLTKRFTEMVKTGIYDETEFPAIIKTCNAMLDLKLTARPYFSDYLEALMVVKSNETGEVRFVKWHEVLNNVLANIEKRKLAPYKDFLKFSQTFFGENKIRSSSSGINWIVANEKYELLFENNEVLLKFDELDLIGARKNDSITIVNTSGIYSAKDKTLLGKGGKVTWKRHDLDDSFYAELDTFKINTTKSIYTASNVKLHYPFYFPNKVIVGSFEDKVVAQNKATEGSYPRFISDEKVLTISNSIGDGISYTGGFRLHGTTVYGDGTEEQDAKVEVRQDNVLALRALSDVFVIRRGEKIVSEGVATTLYFGQDSIYHPSVNFKLDIINKELSLYRGKRGSDRNPFYSSIHKVNMDSEKIDWYMAKDSIVVGQKKMGIAGAAKTVTFESLEYFEEGDFRRLQNISSTNPLSMLKVLADRDGHILSAHEIASHLNPKYDVENIQSLLYDLVGRGFINYDSEKQEVEVKEKLIHYTRASQQKIDYDGLKIISNTENESNAILNLKDKSITTNGVKNVEFSRKQKVATKPAGKQITLKANRDMDFSGLVFSGFSKLDGKDFHFDYDKFHIEMDSIRFFDLFVPDGTEDENGNPNAFSIGSRIEHLSGVLLIDAPANKSGREDVEMFPAFNSKENSYVFYDDKEIQHGLYKRDSFYFQLNKFFFNSLDKFTADDVNFKGKLFPAEIFPPFEETLVVMPEDQSLGFTTQTTGDGFPTYVGKGNYKGELELSNKGLLGKGNVTYLKASMDSEDIIFRPRQMLASAEEFNLEEDRQGSVKFPQASGIDVKINWKPYQDSMFVRSEEAPFNIFKDGLHTLEKELILTPNGLKGRSKFDWDKGLMNSNLFSFGPHAVDSDTANLQIKAIGSSDIALATENVNARMDFDSQKGWVKSNDFNGKTSLPYNQYETTMNEFLWDMKAESITFKAEAGKQKGFLSIHPDQDSLRFDGENAFYSLKTNELKIDGVEYIISADAFIYPENGDVQIMPGGVITTFNNSRIVCDTLSKYHVINRATVDIKGRKEYTAEGFYEYNIGDRKQEIKFAEIIGTRVGKGNRATKPTATRATGEVTEADNFYIDKKTEFRGTITMDSDKQNLLFEGFARLDAPLLVGRQWFSINSLGDKKDLKIGYDVPKNYKGDPLNTGLYISKESGSLYSRIMMTKFIRKDRTLMEAKGVFNYNNSNDSFEFGDSTKLIQNLARGTLIEFYNKDGKIIAEGPINLGEGLNYVQMQSAGRAVSAFNAPDSSAPPGAPIKDNTKFEVMSGIDFILPKKLMNIMAGDLKTNAYDAANINFSSDIDYYKSALAEFIPDVTDWSKVTASLKGNDLKLPRKYDKFAIHFGKIPFIWNPEYQSMVNESERVALLTIGGETINKLIQTNIELRMPSNQDDRLYIHITSPSGYFYFFGYKQGIMNVYSNNARFMETLEGLKKKETTFKMDDGEVYEILPVNEGTASAFMSRIRDARK